MSIVPSSFAAGFAGAIAARPAAPEAERVIESAKAHQKEQAAAEESERASGMGDVEEEQATQDRDGDGRQMYDFSEQQHAKASAAEADDQSALAQVALAKDVTGDCGNLLDLQG
jgi:hypothetical protein